jgi:hypothetical protein
MVTSSIGPACVPAGGEGYAMYAPVARLLPLALTPYRA